MKNNLCNMDKLISNICVNEYDYFLRKNNVVGVGLGYKVQNGFDTNIKCIVVFVAKKIDKSNLCSNDLIPNLYKGIQTDVIESGQIYAMSLTQRVRPTICGYSIGPEDIRDALTLGCIVKDTNLKLILTCNHGIVHNILPIGSKILQPGVSDGGKSPQDIIGELVRYVPLKPITFLHEPVNYVDACIIGVEDESLISNEIYGVGKIKGVSFPVLNQPVVKVGSTTSITTGKITSINATVKVNIGSKKYLFKEQIITTQMCQKGDSGAILLGNGNSALGLLAGGGKSISTCNTIGNVLGTFHVKINMD